ncbi:hypothetical protein Taro_056703, partial [Colocasia esculenta]|nr:hypothetical protein [Colocasia esculenta]
LRHFSSPPQVLSQVAAGDSSRCSIWAVAVRGYKAPCSQPDIVKSSRAVTVSEVEALYELFKKLSNSIIKDGLIHKEELLLGLFRNSYKENLFADRHVNLNTEMPLSHTTFQSHVFICFLASFLSLHNRDITLAFPSFVMHSEVEDADSSS